MGDGIGLPEKPNSDRVSVASVSAVGIAAAVLNFVFVFELAVAAGYAKAIAWLYWVVLDGTGLASMRVVLARAGDTRVRRLASFTALLALAVSIGACGLHAFLDGGELPRWAKFIVSALPALMLGLSCKLLLSIGVPGSAAVARPQVIQGPVTTPCSKAADQPEYGSAEGGQTAGETLVASSTRKTERFKAALARLDPADARSTNELVAALNVGIDLHPGTARRLVGAWRSDAGDIRRLETAS